MRCADSHGERRPRVHTDPGPSSFFLTRTVDSNRSHHGHRHDPRGHAGRHRGDHRPRRRRRRGGVREPRCEPYDHRPHRRRRAVRHTEPARHAGRRGRRTGLHAVQAREQGEPSPTFHGDGARRADRPGHRHPDRGPVRGRDAGADAGGRADGQGGGRDAAARRRLQAAHLAVRLPGAGREGPAHPGRGARGDRPADRHRGRGRPRRGARGVVRRHAAGRHPQRAELRAAAGRGRGGQAGHAEAGHDGDHRGVADGGRVRRPARQPRHRAVRAGHPHLRARHPQHARHLGGPGRAAAVAPAGDRGPVALRRPARPRAAAVAGRGRGRGRRPDRRPCTPTPSRPCATARRPW